MGNKEEIDEWLKNKPPCIMIEEVNFYHNSDSIQSNKLLSIGTQGEIKIFIIEPEE